MARGEIGSYPSTVELPTSADTGGHADPSTQGAQIGAAIQGLGEKISQGAATVGDLAIMRSHMASQQWVSKTMADHQLNVDKFMADPKNYTDPNYAANLQKMTTSQMSDIQKQAPNVLARNQITEEMNTFHSDRMNSAFKTQTDVMLQKGYNDFAMTPNNLLNSYRTNLKTPNIDAGAELYKQADATFKKIDATYGVVAPQMARELKDEVTSQLAYGVVNHDPDLAEKVLNRGYIEGRTRHFLEDAIQTARSQQDMTAKATASDAVRGLLTKAEMFPEEVQKGFPPEYFTAHGFSHKDAVEQSTKLQYQLDVNKDYATTKSQISGYNETAMLKKLDEMGNALKTLPGDSDKFNHDAQVYQLTSKYVNEMRTKLHEDPIGYLTQNNKFIKSAAEDYRGNPSPEKFQNLATLLKKYQGAPEPGDDPGHYLNLAMHEMHLMDKEQAETAVGTIMKAGPKQGADMLHATIQQYKPEDQGMVLSDLTNHGLPGSMWAVEAHYGAPFMDKLMGSIVAAKDLAKTVGTQKGSTKEDFDKILATDNDWQRWSKATVQDNFQNSSVLEGVHDAAISYAMGLVQDGASPAAAMKTAVKDLTQEGHVEATVNGHSLFINQEDFKGTSAQFTRSIQAAVGHLDFSRIKLTDDYHRPLFPVMSMFGYEGTAQHAIQEQVARHAVPHMNPDRKSFSLYYQDGGNLFQLRDVDGKPFNLNIKDMPVVHDERHLVSSGGNNPYSIGGMSGSSHWETMSTTNWPTMSAPKTAIKPAPADNSTPPDDR